MFVHSGSAVVSKEGAVDMSVYLRITLIISSILTCVYIARKLRKSQIQVMDTVFWIGLSVVFIVLSIFPQVAAWGAELFGFMASVNFIFLVVIFLLLLRCFSMTIRISQLEEKLHSLVEELAIREKKRQDSQEV